MKGVTVGWGPLPEFRWELMDRSCGAVAVVGVCMCVFKSDSISSMDSEGG